MKNNNPFGILPATTAMKPGQVYLANEGAVGNEFLSQALTQYSVGWTSPDGVLEKLLEDLAGAPITVGKRFAFKAMDNAKAFAAAENDEDVRAIGADFKRIEISGSTVDSHTVSKGLTLRIDRDEHNDDPEAEQKAVAYLRTILLRAEIIRALSGLAGVATNTAKTWSAAEGTPDQDLLEKIDAAGDSLGFNPNRILFGSTAWQKRLLCLGSKNTAGGFAGYSLSPDALAQFLAVDKVMVSSERYTSGTGKAKIVGAAIALMFTGSDSASTEDPSNAKTFWSPVMGGGEYAVFKDETQAEFVKVTVMHKSQIVLTNTLGMQKLTIS